MKSDIGEKSYGLSRMGTSANASVSSLVRRSKWYGRVPIAATLATSIGFLVLLTAGIVFAVGVWLAQKNTFDLLSDNAHQAISSDANQIVQYLRPAEHQTRFIAESISQGRTDPDNQKIFETFLIGALAAVPQIEAIVFIDANLQSLVVNRNFPSEHITPFVVDNSNDEVVKENIRRLADGAFWQPPIWRDLVDKTYLSRAHPVVVDGELIGAVIAVVSVRQLSDFISMKDLETEGSRFILYGRDSVLAHWLMADGYPDKSNEYPLPPIERFGDPVLASMWQTTELREIGLSLPEGTYGHSLEALGGNYVFFYRELTGFGAEPLIVGTYFQPSDRPEEIERLFAALAVGLLTLLISLLAAVALGRRIARPIVKFSSAASRIQYLDVSKVQSLPSSVFEELNDQSVAFNAMLRALRWFEFYVPKKVVEQLIRYGDIIDSQSSAREITVMFTDVVGFSSISEGMEANEVARFINQHFSIVVGCVESAHGTVDKYMGDAVMAFWQESENQKHSAQLACDAAVAISRLIEQDNEKRVNQGQKPVGMRIGMHTGVATVGNIGAPGRLNYTIIGDTVNVGQRLEMLGKEVNPEGTGVTILLSGNTASELDSNFDAVALGSFSLQGRTTEIEVYSLG